MQAAIRTVGGELAQAAAEGMMSVDLRRAEAEIARLTLELTEARTELERYAHLEAEADKLRAENARLRVEVEMLKYQVSKYVKEKVERLREISRVNRPAPLCARLWIGLSAAWDVITGGGERAARRKR